MSAERVREILRERGCTESVVDGGLSGLVSDWDEVVQALTKGYEQGLDDYLHDVDGREMIAAVINGVPAALTPALKRKLNEIDKRAKAALEPHTKCLWGDRLAKSSGWTREEHWWYFMRPKSPGPELAEELGLT